ncbi:MAG: hypothetical protein H7Y32_17610, partial [Chloroflexales bacterium]|nr:hypothetical protein [Chloroflexales bacterium]
MTLHNYLRWLASALCVATLAGCGPLADVPTAATAQATAAGDTVATQVAIAQAVAATLTAVVLAAPSPTTETAQEATPELPTITVAVDGPTAAPPPPTVAPIDTAVPPPTVFPTNDPELPIPIAYAPGGNADNVLGGIVVPDDARITSYSEGNDLEVSFKSSVWFRILAYVPSGDGNDKDGAGIKEVRVAIVGPVAGGENDIVHERTEMNAAYCVFGGGEPDCSVWDFAANDNKWPGGEPVQYGENYHVQINIDGADGDSG